LKRRLHGVEKFADFLVYLERLVKDLENLYSDIGSSETRINVTNLHKCIDTRKANFRKWVDLDEWLVMIAWR